MKKIYSAILVLLISGGLSAQCLVQVVANDVTCFGACDGSATAYPVGMVAPITYAWSPQSQSTQTAVGLCAGTHYVIATDSLGCVTTGIVTVGSPSQLQAIITNVVNPSCPSCCDGSLTGNASGGNAPYTYLWTPGNVTTLSITGLCAGSYTLCVVDANGCASCDTVAISFPMAITSTNASASLELMPNPTNGEFVLHTDFTKSTDGTIRITNALGQIVSESQFFAISELNQTIDLSNQPNGIYLVSVVSGDGIAQKRVVKQ